MRPSLFRRLRRDRRGNVLMIFGLALPPLIFATGMGIDYGAAMQLQTKLNAAADAAALSATSLGMMDKPAAAAEAQARIVFQTQVTNSPGLVAMNYLDPRQFNVAIGETNSQAEGFVRTATVTYRGQSTNTFARVLGTATLTIKGTAVAKASTAPNIDFYVMLDASSSMALPTTTAGINFLKSRTVRNDRISNPNGCAFACHQTNPDNPNVRDRNGNYMDYYDLAHNNGIELRIDAGKHAIRDMVTEAQSQSADNGAAYRFYLSTFDRASNFRSLTGNQPTSNYDYARAQAATAETVAVAMDSYLYDRQTEHAGSLTKMGQAMPANAGNGMRTGFDTPQMVLFLITDGMRDEEINGRQMGAITTSNCDALKQRGVRIAVLYTTYQPESVNYDWWSATYVVPRLPQISPALQACASPNLFFEVSTDGSISAALNALLHRTIQTSRLVR